MIRPTPQQHANSARAMPALISALAVGLLASAGCARWGFDPQARTDGSGYDGGFDAAADASNPPEGSLADGRPVRDAGIDAAMDAAAVPDGSVVGTDLAPTDAALDSGPLVHDAPVPPADTSATDMAPSPDLPWPADAAVPDTVPSPDLPWPPDSAPAPDGPPPPTGVLWAQSFGDTLTDTGAAVAVDSSGNIYLTGSFAGTVDFGCGSSLTGTGTGTDIFVASYTPAGACRWAQRFGGTNIDAGQAVAVDPSDNVSITGWFMSASVDFGGGPLNNSASMGGTRDLFVASFSSTGGLRWARVAGDNAATDEGRGITADPAGNVTITGVFGGTVDMGCGNLKANGSSADIFVASYDSSGTCRWDANYGSPTFADVGTAVASDASGNLYVTGGFWDAASFGGTQLASNGDGDVFLASYTSGGAYRWANGYGGTNNDSGTGVAVDANGNVFVTGTFQNSADFGGGPLVSAGGADAFFASCSASTGTYRWAQSLGGASVDAGRAVAVDSSGNAFFVGRFEGIATWGATALASAGFSDIFVVSTTSTGAPRWAKRIGGAGDDYGYGAALSSAGLVITGEFNSSTLDLGVIVLNTAGNSDILLATVTP